MHPHLKALIAAPIAHRGLHDGNASVWENTRSAFEAAIIGGYGIELDVQLSADNEAIVFHDLTLDRLTKASGAVRSKSSDALRELPVGNTNDVPEPLSDILDLINGQVAVVVEMKDNGNDNADLAAAVSKAVNAYSGAIAVMSFSQDLLQHIKEIGIHCPIGLTTEGSGTKALEAHNAAYELGISFVSYHVHALPNAFVDDARTRGMPVITWTVRSPKDAELTYKHADQITFEGFTP
ncbi:MAG: glycerophosphodiester phosphodiesterase family protein [Pseudomonadota bacterium]